MEISVLFSMACDGRSGLISSWFQHCLPLYELRITSCLPAVRKLQRKVHTSLNASWKICSLAVNGQSFLVIDGYLLNSFKIPVIRLIQERLVDHYFLFIIFLLVEIVSLDFWIIHLFYSLIIFIQFSSLLQIFS